MRCRSLLLALALPFTAGGLGLATLGLATAGAALPSGSAAEGPAATGPGATGPAAGGEGPGASMPPAPMLGLYVSAAAGTCPGLPWSVLAAVGTVESDNGESAAVGVRSGANRAGAEGPMQFEPATFAEYALPVPPGGALPPSPYDPIDSVWAAARLLCADGAATGDLADALFSYNHSSAYVAEVLARARSIDEMRAADS